VSTPRCTHLLCADEVLSEGYRYRGTYIAVCGEPIEASSLLITSWSDEGGCEVTYCPGCLDAVNKRTWEGRLRRWLSTGDHRGDGLAVSTAGDPSVSWFLRSMADSDSHRGDYSIVTRSVPAVCGIEFVSKELPLSGPALPGSPLDSGQVCPNCQRAAH
jgi:hypothetical protein